MILEEDIAKVRERASIEDIVREHVALRNAGGGSFKGLCPFHDEKSPSFQVTPQRQMFYCFGCGEGGDIFTFLQKIEHLTFAEAVEKLAERYEITLHYTEGDGPDTSNRLKPGQRNRLVKINSMAVEFFVSEFAKLPDDHTAVRLLGDRGFTRDNMNEFEVGYAPQGWDATTKFLRSQGFTDAELLAAGISTSGNRGVYDRFRGRLMWPIRDLSGDPVGFGGRRLFPDDDGPKFLNTPETVLYKKNQVLYGIDRARKSISTQRQAIIVEGYADVMACRLAGFDTAVAACGTAFGSEHIKVIRRLLMDDDRMRGEVVFTFDGDAAGQKAALRAFSEDQKFIAQTFVCVEPNGLDPCDVRMQKGDDGVRELMANKVPLFEFALKTILKKHNLNIAPGRISALREVAPLVGQIKDPALRPEYVRLVAGWIGIDINEVRKAVNYTLKDTQKANNTSLEQSGKNTPDNTTTSQVKAENPNAKFEKEALKCFLQVPELSRSWFDSFEESSFTDEKSLDVYRFILNSGGIPESIPPNWVQSMVHSITDETLNNYMVSLSVEPLLSTEEKYVIGVLAKILDLDAARRAEELKSRLQRLQGSPNKEEMTAVFNDLVAIEAYRRDLKNSL